MSFVRTVKKENPFVQIDKYFLNDENLTWSAKGILAYILSKPNDWVIRKEDLIRRSGDGKAKVEAALLNLLANGYINWFQEKEDDGTFGEWVYDVYERPEFNPNLESCKEMGYLRIMSKKNKTKERNSKPKVNNQVSGSPKVNNPLSDNPTSDNHPFTKNDFSNNDFNNILEEEEEKELNSLVSFFSKNITESGKEAVKQNIAKWLKILPYEVIKLEIENCSLYGAKTWIYVEKALQESLDLKIVTIEALQQKYDRHQEKSKGNKKNRGKVKTVRKENIPDWFEKSKEESAARAAAATSKEDEVTMEQVKKELEEFELKKKKLEESIEKRRKNS